MVSVLLIFLSPMKQLSILFFLNHASGEALSISFHFWEHFTGISHLISNSSMICHWSHRNHNLQGWANGGKLDRMVGVSSLNIFKVLKSFLGASLVAQWLRIRWPMQGPWVRARVWEDPTCHRATKPVRHNYWACALEPATHNYWACMPQLLLKPACIEPVLCNERSHRNEKPAHRNTE